MAAKNVTPKGVNQEENIKPKKSIGEHAKELLQMLLIVWIIISSVVEASRVPTGSMETTILPGDFLFINKFIYGPTTPRFIPYTNVELPYFRFPSIREPQKNDVIVFKFPGYRDQIESPDIQFYVKRCVAEPGDTLEVRNKVVFINGVEQPIPPRIQYLKEFIEPAGKVDRNIFPVGKPWNSDNYGPLVVPKKGDIINLSLDNIEEWKTFINREYGKDVVSISNGQIAIEGKITDKYEVKQDYYFGMGDNRDDSLDSRFWGFIPRENIVGSPIIIYWSWDSDIPIANFFKLLGSVRFDRIAKLIN